MQNVFLADKKNAGLLTGDKKRIGSSIVMMALALIFIAVCVVGAYAAYDRYTTHQTIVNNGKEARAVITDGFEQTTRRYVVIEETRYNVTYRYTVNGVTYEVSQDIGADLFNNLFLDDRVTVAYVQGNPNLVELSGQFRDDTQYNNGMILFVAILVVALFTAAYFLFKDARNRRLSSQGQMLDGQLMSASGQYYRGTLNVTFNYAFRSPLGVDLRGKRTVARNDLKKQPIPSTGTLVKVLYVNDKLHRLL